MTLDQVRLFVAVAEREHVTKAAQALHLAQSAVSHGIASLEAQYATRLFNRVGRGIELTEAGRAFLIEARAILAQVERAEAVLADFDASARGTLRVQASQTIASYWLPRRLAAFREAHPRIRIEVAIGNTAQVAQAIEAGAAELGFVEGSVANPRLAAIPVARDQLVLVVGPAHPWAGRRTLEAADFPESDWVLREPGSGTRSVFEQALVQLGIDPASLPVALELPSNEAVRGAVEANLGATALSASVAAPSLEAGLLQSVPFALPERQFVVLHHAQRSLGRLAQAFLALLGR